MKRKRIGAGVLLLVLLAGCGPAEVESGPSPSPEVSPSPAASQLEWLHGFYAASSYRQIGLADDMDAVSLGWGRMYVDEEGVPYVNTTTQQGNTWAVPQSSHLATDYFQARDIPYNLCVYATTGHAYGETSVLAYLLTPPAREAAVAALVEAAEGYSGLTIDFEGLTADHREGFTEFMGLLREALGQDKGLYVAVQPDEWYKGYDYRALGELCDKVILMAHDYQWSRAPEENLGTDHTDTPVAPIGRVELALARITDPDTGVRDRSKLALAVAFATAGVEVDEEGLLLDTTVYSPSPETLAARLAQEDAQLGWSGEYASPYVYYHNEEGKRYRVWYEDARSVEEKIDLALRYGVTGLSVWRLGTVPDFEGYHVWETILAARTGE